MDIPGETPPDLAERYRQLRPFDRAEVTLVRALVRQPDRLSRTHEIILRRALNLARLWVVQTRSGECVVGPQLSEFRDRVQILAEQVTQAENLDPETLGPDAAQLDTHVQATKSELLSRNLGRLSPEELEEEISAKALVLAVGGGGGCGYAHLGAFSTLESLGLRPRFIAGASIGSILGLFRARWPGFRNSTIRAVTQGLNFREMFRILDAETRYAMPGALRLYLRTSLSRYFLNSKGETLRLGELELPLAVVVTGVHREAAREVGHYEQLVQRGLRRGTLGRLLHIRDLVTNVVSFLSELVQTPGAMRPIVLGADRQTRGFDVLDAVGFSSALPAVIQYDITREDPRMHELMQQTLRDHDVDFLADGGIASNVPARAAWEAVQRGQIGTRNAFILGLDCFAPQMRRNVMFLPLMRLAAENVAVDRLFAHSMFTYRHAPSPTALVPGPRALQSALEEGKREFAREGPFLRKMFEPLSA